MEMNPTVCPTTTIYYYYYYIIHNIALQKKILHIPRSELKNRNASLTDDFLRALGSITPQTGWCSRKTGRETGMEGCSKEHSVKQKWPRETHSVTFVPGLSTLSGLSRIVAQPPPWLLCCPRPPSHHPSNPTSVSLVPFPHWHRPPTPIWPYGTHPFFPHAQTIPTLSDLLYSLTLFLFRL